MSDRFFKQAILFLFLFFLFQPSYSQLQHGLRDGRMNSQCSYLIQLIQQKPKEVLFGIQIQGNGEIYFSMTSKAGYEGIFNSPTHGITVDLVEKGRYDCAKPTASSGLVRGYLINPVYKAGLDQELKVLQDGAVFI